MHPRMLARDNCSGGTCPAIYDLEDLPGQLIVQGKKIPADLFGRLTGVARDETAVIIGRDTITAALYPVPERIGAAELEEQFRTFSYSAFRLEALQHYAGTARDEEWITLLKRSRRWGKTHQRIHVVTEPLTAAMQQELTEGYQGNVAAGEDIRIVAVTAKDDWPADLPRSDFWLFDGWKLYVMHYAPHDGTWIGAERVTDPERIVGACRARDAALHRWGVPWREYIASHPDLVRRVAR